MRLTTIAGILASSLPAVDWPGFRGANGQGLQPAGRSLPVEFGPASHVIWKAEVPYGASTPIVAGSRV